MKKLLLFSFLFLQFFCACHNKEKDNEATASENDVDAARNFIRAALDGDYSKARRYMLQDSLNTQFIDAYENNYQQRMNKEDKRGYRESSINVHDVRQVNDSVTIVNYSNSYKKKDDSLKVIRQNGQWLVDFKYSFPRSGPDKIMH